MHYHERNHGRSSDKDDEALLAGGAGVRAAPRRRHRRRRSDSPGGAEPLRSVPLLRHRCGGRGDRPARARAAAPGARGRLRARRPRPIHREASRLRGHRARAPARRARGRGRADRALWARAPRAPPAGRHPGRTGAGRTLRRALRLARIPPHPRARAALPALPRGAPPRWRHVRGGLLRARRADPRGTRDARGQSVLPRPPPPGRAAPRSRARRLHRHRRRRCDGVVDGLRLGACPRLPGQPRARGGAARARRSLPGSTTSTRASRRSSTAGTSAACAYRPENPDPAPR